MSEQGLKNNWFARIKWWDNIVEAVPVSRIRKFHPKSLTDFNPNEWYRVKGKKESYSDGVAHSGWALIGLLTETLVEAENPTRRVAFPPITAPSCDPDSSSTEREKLKERYNQNTIEQQDKAKALNRQKKLDHANSFKAFEANFMRGTEISKENREEPKKKGKEKSKENRNQLNIVTPEKTKENQDQRKIAAMELKIKQLEEDLKKERQIKKRKVESPADNKILDAYVKKLNKEWETREAELRNSVLEDFQQYQKSIQDELEKMNEILSKSNELSNFTRTKQWVESQSFTSPS